MQNNKLEIWVVLDKDGYPVYTAGWKEACHEHINDAVLHDKSAGKWVARQVALQPTKTESVLIEGVAYTLPIEVACELLRLHIELKTAEKNAQRYQWLRDERNWDEDGIAPIVGNGEDTIYGEALDAAIDAAIQAGEV